MRLISVPPVLGLLALDGVVDPDRLSRVGADRFSGEFFAQRNSG